jgi:hypothetical protein
MTIRARLLAILKEPDRFGISDWAKHSDGAHNQRASEICADKNARHRLKRLCEEIAKVCSSPIRIPGKFEGEWVGEGWFERLMDGIECAAAILALGEDNEHS